MSDGRLVEDLGGVAGLLLLDDADEVALQRGHSATGTARSLEEERGCDAAR